MRALSIAAVALALVTGPAGVVAAQDAPPVEQLAQLRPYLGMYRHADQTWITDQPGQGPWRGTLEVKPALKGWFVEWVINTQSGPIDRQLRMLMTWDAAAGEYRVWRFATVAGDAGHMGRVRFDGDALIMEWHGAPMPDGSRGIFRNTVRMHGGDELVIRSEAEQSDGAVVLLGEWTNRRLL